MASIFRTFLEKLGGSTVASYIGKKGDLFFDPDQATPVLKVSDGVTAGGVDVTGVGGGTGPTGPAGADGNDGTDGTDGTDGSIGPAGADGTDGTDGATGPTGPAGSGLSELLDDTSPQFGGLIDFNQQIWTGHFIPQTDNAHDIGSSSKKIRDLFVSQNSLWVGDNHKLDTDEEGKAKFRKRKKGKTPKTVSDVLIGEGKQFVNEAAMKVDFKSRMWDSNAPVNTLDPEHADFNPALDKWPEYLQLLGHSEYLFPSQVFDTVEDFDVENPTYNKVIATAVGQAGDKAGQLNWNPIDPVHLYYCTQDYDGTTLIWKQIILQDF